MARPTKQGVEYFPLDVQFDTQMKMLICNKGAAGLGVVVTIWQLTYQDKGYYLENSEDLPHLINSLIGIEVQEIKEIINKAIDKEIFNKEMFEKYNILTSRGIQKRYLIASKRKKHIEIIKNYFLVDFSENKNVTSVGLPSYCIHDVNIVHTSSIHDVNIVQPKEEEEVNVKEKVKVNVKENKKLLPKNGKKDSVQKNNFNIFWKKYPKKKSKGQAERTWAKLKPDNNLFKVILSKIEEAKNSKDWIKQSGQFIPYPSTWLNNKGWEDEYKQKQQFLSDTGMGTVRMLNNIKLEGEI